MSQTHTAETAPQAPQHRSKPVLVYIFVLFIAAFLLMALSFVSQQKSNEEALGNVHATLKDLQAEQAQLPELKEELADLKNQLAESQELNKTISSALGDTAQALESTATALEETKTQLRAMEQLYCLRQWYDEGNYAACDELIEAMIRENLVNALPDEPYPHDNGTVPAPGSQFVEIREAVTAALAETAAK